MAVAIFVRRWSRPVQCRVEGARDVDIYTIIFLALAVFIFLRLRSVLGQRTGGERPPYDRAARDVVQGRGDTGRSDNVVPIPGTIIDQAPLAPADPAAPTERWKGTAEPGSELARGLDDIAKQDSAFDPKHFAAGAKSAYEMIVMAFAQGDRRTLKDLLSGEVFDSFEGAIREREQRGEQVERKFVGIDKAEIVSAEQRGRVANLTVRFVSQMISVTRDKAGAVVDGNPEAITDVTDVWTFSRDMASRDPNWRLIGTEGGQ
jgi:predicted lipid-binding transport protein (Tim44 family)